MADITCPSCGKLNPEGLHECQFCHADLATSTISSIEAEERTFTASQDVPLENPPAQEPEIPEEVEKDQPGTDAPVQEAESETPEWLRRIRIRLASEGPPGKQELGNPDLHEWDVGDESQEEIANEGSVMPSSDFLDWSDPERQASDTVPMVPGESLASEPGKSRGAFSGMEEASSPEQFLRVEPSPAFSYNLRITSTQHAHADLLDSVVNSEGIAAPLPRRKQATASPLLRWAIATILFLAILWPILTRAQGAPAPFLAEETGQVNNLIEQLPEDASVLLAFDYDPGFSGELDAAAAAVVDHLISRGAYLALVSTLPTGPVLAERFLSHAMSRHDLVRNTHYVNLGFIPGGPTGLVSLSEDLQRALPYTLDGEAAWKRDGGPAGRSEFPPLEGIQQISDFSLVLILVDDSFTARTWIEQVQPSLAVGSFQTPMAMVVSAQVEPLVRPYYDANPRQVYGFVSGLRGGTAYEQLTGREVMPGYTWDAFISGMSAAGLLLLIGGVAGIALTLFDQRGQEQNGGKA